MKIMPPRLKQKIMAPIAIPALAPTESDGGVDVLLGNIVGARVLFWKRKYPLNPEPPGRIQLKS
jgi:hypothetical protein